MGYEIRITKTARPTGRRGDWSTFDNERKEFRRKQEVINFLKENYGKSRRQKMYVDTKKGETKQVGWIYKMGVQRDWSHNDPSRWYQQDWVSVNQIRRRSFI